jgi:hypothetical protein
MQEKVDACFFNTVHDCACGSNTSRALIEVTMPMVTGSSVRSGSQVESSSRAVADGRSTFSRRDPNPSWQRSQPEDVAARGRLRLASSKGKSRCDKLPEDRCDLRSFLRRIPRLTTLYHWQSEEDHSFARNDAIALRFVSRGSSIGFPLC